MNVLITICARAGSTGVKNKNFRDFLGHPLIYYTIRAAGLFKEEYGDTISADICVSTDSKDILSYISGFPDVIAIERPAGLAQADIPKVPVIQQAALFMESRQNARYDYVIDLDVTSPLRKAADMKRALDKCAGPEGFGVVFSAIESRRNPYFNMVELDGSGEAHKVKDSDFVCRQQAPAVYDMNASIYCYNRDCLINELHRITFEAKSGMIEMPETYVIDIDKREDFEVLELLVEHKFRENYVELFGESTCGSLGD